ncbi:MAG: type II secretion system protein N [Burkholderiales bacterium]
MAVSRWAESTYAEAAWGRARAGGARWAWAGAVSGTLVALICFAPASWLAEVISAATAQRLLLSDARGSIWSGSAVLVLTGGPDSRDSAALPGRLAWTVRPRGMALETVLRQSCCLHGDVTVVWAPGFGGYTVTLNPSADWVGQWPSAWLAGLGTPWNTLRLGGTTQLLSSGLTIESAQGRWRLTGGLDIELRHASSRLSTLETLGSYRLSVQGGPQEVQRIGTRSGIPAGEATITLSTMEGALLLSGNGTWGMAGLRFQGEASAVDPDDAALGNLLNIIGRRDGARSVISIG